MARIVIGLYRPFVQTSRALMLDAIRSHHATLRVEQLVTERAPILMEAEDGTFLEVFELADGAGANIAEHKAVKKIRKRLEELCEIAPLISLQEAETAWPSFKPVDGVL
jgi:hypothetical protein